MTDRLKISGELEISFTVVACWTLYCYSVSAVLCFAHFSSCWLCLHWCEWTRSFKAPTSLTFAAARTGLLVTPRLSTHHSYLFSSRWLRYGHSSRAHPKLRASQP